MKKIISLIAIIFILEGCGYSHEIQHSEINEAPYHETKINVDMDEGILLNSIPEYSDVHDIGIPLKTGQSEIIRISQEEFLTITQEELTNYLNNRKKCENHDWHAIVIGSNVAILCSYNQNEFIYGIWDENLGITENLATHEDATEFYTMVQKREN